ncbi:MULTISPECIES: CaiB/BaiF CoA-transferase family protein [Pseudonocardia]|uniref:Crotonobetainyl-CoA:carnitine CoA-transferase CaiB-like acyl-CoA transferase n=1 Tax=Pseudonocardia alni TaxID=33907 RepID=A0A852W540_PSEA5|nr:MULTISPECIES: CaiB/BaiF CoA-transferase family protein [Pseudonocardia]MCO7195535.1 CoA transferase [Pseudonocardia sp. McavD-2-B]NYG04207.1 crotonobetainyl-CoA:carnitine CoA-transferase CaiB-like acyl-CoA transferase [Pseudonocardia antarctica]OJG04719.1 Formyl-coenzyme A transferase [Pseudonocardia autotrophica]
MALPLDGLLVVSCEQAVAAPLATRHLADLGARVIKIEREGSGDFARDYDETVHGMSSHFVWLNRSKESVTLDLKSDDGRATMLRLLDRADVFVQNFAPGAAERLGLGAAALRERYPRLVTCSISGYGSSGPYRDAKAYDLLIQSEAGLVSITGTEDAPAKSGIPAADIGAGMYAFSGILSALYERERTGQGTDLEVSLFDSLVEWMGYPLYYAGYGGTAPKRTGTSHAAIAPYGTFSAGDGTDVVLSIQNEREWATFCEVVLGRPEVATDPRFASGRARVENRPDLHAEIDTVFTGLTGDELVARLVEARIAHARQREVGEVLEHPQLAARDRWTEVGSPVGPLRALRPPITVAGRTARMDPVPAVGEHTDAVLAWLDER